MDFRQHDHHRSGPSHGPLDLFPTRRPELVTLPAVRVECSSFRLRGRLNALRPGVETWFEFAEERSMRGAHTTVPRPMRQDVREAVVAETVFGVQPGATYYYRVAARTGGEVRYGPVLEVTTRLVAARGD